MTRRVDRAFQSLLKDVMEKGKKDRNPRPVWESDGAPAYSYFLTQYFEKYDTEHGEVPITSLRPIYVKKAIEEMLWIFQDQTSDLKKLEERGVMWWSNWKLADGTIGERYGKTIANYDLVNQLLTGLKENPFSRRHIMSMWQEKDLAIPAKLPPCAYETIWSVRPGEKEGPKHYLLDCTLIQRSNDIGPAMHVNLMQYHALQLAFAKHCSYQVGNLARMTQNIHLYDRHLEQAKIMLERTGQETEPVFYLDVPDGTSFYDLKATDFILENYQPIKPQLKFELAV